MALVVYPEEATLTAELKVYKDESFEANLNSYPSDRYGYSLQYFTRKASKGMIPTQVHKILDYAKQNDLQLFDPEEGYVVPGHVYLQNGPKAKKNWSSVPFSIAVWEALSNPTNLKIIEERIKVWNTAADLKLVGIPQGSKVDLAKPVAHFETSDERVQVQIILDRFETSTLGVVEKSDLDCTRLCLLYKFDKEHIASVRPASPQQESDVNYLRSIHTFSKVSFPAKQFIDWMKNHGSQFLKTITEVEEDETAAKRRKTE